jgi:site-specific recombinase XerD
LSSDRPIRLVEAEPAFLADEEIARLSDALTQSRNDSVLDVLRHAFTSHFVQKGCGNIVTLQRILGHSSLLMTMRYLHLAPDHLADAFSFNPLSIVGRKQ